MADGAYRSAEVRQALTALIDAATAAWNAGDADAFGARALPDIVFTNVLGMFSVGKVPFVAQHARIFATIYRGSTIGQEIQHISLPTPDVAIVDTLSILRDVVHVPPGLPTIDGAIHARLQQVVVQRAGGWWLAAYHNVAINPAFADAPMPLP